MPSKPPRHFDTPDVQRCEPRLALSASLGTDWWLDIDSDHLDDANSPESPSQPATSPGDLIEQAADVAHPLGLDGSGQTAVVIDSGIAFDHIALGGEAGFGPGYRVVGGWDFAENDANPYDDGPAGFHGTHVASVLGGRSDNFSGVAPGADLVSLRVFDDQGHSNLDWVESALQWVYTNQDSFESPISTVNLSLGAALTDATTEIARATIGDELELLRQSDILVFAAAGNFQDSLDGILYPASDPSVVAVSSIDGDGELSSFAQRESGILAAVGNSVVGAVPEHVFGWDGNVDDFATLDGTSLAAPQVAGASILVRQALESAGLPSDGDTVIRYLQESSELQADDATGDTFRPLDLTATLNRIAEQANQNEAELANESPASDFFGTDDSEEYSLNLNTIDVASELTLAFSSQNHLLLADNDGVYRIDAGGGSDELLIQGGSASERLSLRSGESEISEITIGNTRVELSGFETIRFEGGGGNDRATLYDSLGSDTLVSRPRSANLSGIGFEFDVEDVSNIFVHSVAGGADVAYQYDSPGDDVIAIRPEFTSLRSESAFQLAYGFERVSAYASEGNDRADLYDSAGDDTLHLSSARTVLVGQQYQVTANGFDETVARGGNAGNDSVRIYLDDVSDLRAGGMDSGWHGDSIGWEDTDGQRRQAVGFDDRQVFEQYQAIDWETIKQNDLEANRRVFEQL